MNHSVDQSSEFQFLLDRMLADEPGAFDELALAATERLRNLARTMLRRYPHVRRWEDTDDVFQAVLIRLHRSLGAVKPRSTRDFLGLAVTQMRRALIDLARHYYGVYGHGTKHHSEGGGKAADDSGGILARATGGSERPEALQDWAAFHHAIDSLPSDEQEVFSLVWYGGLMQKEVARLLGVSEKTVVRRLNRARLGLHDLMDGQAPEME